MAVNTKADRQPTTSPLGKLDALKPFGLWALQGLLAALFLFAGGMKLVMSADDLKRDVDLPDSFLRFIGVAEVFGAIGLVAPGIFRIRQGLTPLAGVGLVIIMTGAVVVTIGAIGITPALYPLAVGLLLMLIVYGRWHWLSDRPSAKPS